MNVIVCYWIQRINLLLQQYLRILLFLRHLLLLIIKHTKESIMLSVKYEKNEYKIADKSSNSSYWSVFSLLGRIVGPDSYEIIPKFASCKTCFQTYSYSSTASALSNHKCSSLTNQNQSKIQVIKISKSDVIIYLSS